MNKMLIEMADLNGVRNDVRLFSSYDTWCCGYDYRHDNFKLEFSEEGATPEEAVSKVYARWLALGKGPVKEIAPKLLTSPETEDFLNA